MRPSDQQFVQHLLACQDRLYAYILSLVANADETEEVLQETNLVLCRRAEEYAEIENFAAWAFRIAHFQVLALFKRRGADRLRFDDELISQLASEAPAEIDDAEARQRALKNCLGQLPERHRAMVTQRYAGGGSVEAVAAAIGSTTGSVSQTLYRIRRRLMVCIERTLAREERGDRKEPK